MSFATRTPHLSWVTAEAYVTRESHENSYGMVDFSQSYGMFRLECAKWEIPRDNTSEGRREMTGSIPLICQLSREGANRFIGGGPT